MVAERRCDTTKTAAKRRRSEKEHSNVETNKAKIRDAGGLESDCFGEEETTGGLVGLIQQLLVNGRWVTVTGDDAEYIKKMIVIIAQMEPKMDLTVASDRLDVAWKQEECIRKEMERMKGLLVELKDMKSHSLAPVRVGCHVESNPLRQQERIQ